MKVELLEILRCPATGKPLTLHNERMQNGDVESGELRTADGSRHYPILNFIPRFVPPDNYAQNFGFQWNRFRRTQLDSHSGQPISKDRFYGFTRWTPEELAGKRVLDVGCGAGRFTEIALAAGANVVALDYSHAVDACWENHRSSDRLSVVQGDVYQLPFAPQQFDFVYCLGVLQHTPDVRGAVLALPRQLREGGKITVDLYPKLAVNPLLPRYLLRPITRRVQPQRLFAFVERAVPYLLPMSNAIGRIPGIGRKLRHIVPVANYDGVFNLSPQQLQEWAILDTFDWFSPAYDQPQSASTLRQWLEEAGLEGIWVGRQGFLVGRGRSATRTAGSATQVELSAEQA